MDTQEKKVCQTIKRSFAQLKAVLEQRETEMLNKAVTLALGEEGCSDSSEEVSPNGRCRNPEPGGVCGAEPGEHE